MKKYLPALVIFLNSYDLPAQNLIQNGSLDIPGCSVTIPTYWTNPTNGSPDFWSVCAGNAPANWFGYQLPNSGDVFFGIVIKNSGVGTQEWREYLQNNFSSPMVTGQAYMLSMYISLAEYSMYGSSSLGALFTTYPFFYSTNLPIYTPPQVSIDTSNYITDTLNWQLVQIPFIADSAYMYVTIGNFLMDAQTTYTLVNPNAGYYRSYFLIDDISLSDVTGTDEYFTDDIKIYPNPVSNYLYIQNALNHRHTEVKIYNQLGQMVLKTNIRGAGGKVNLTNLSNGVYFYIAGNKSGKIMLNHP